MLVVVICRSGGGVVDRVILVAIGKLVFAEFDAALDIVGGEWLIAEGIGGTSVGGTVVGFPCGGDFGFVTVEFFFADGAGDSKGALGKFGFGVVEMATFVAFLADAKDVGDAAKAASVLGGVRVVGPVIRAASVCDQTFGAVNAVFCGWKISDFVLGECEEFEEIGFGDSNAAELFVRFCLPCDEMMVKYAIFVAFGEGVRDAGNEMKECGGGEGIVGFACGVVAHDPLGNVLVRVLRPL